MPLPITTNRSRTGCPVDLSLKLIGAFTFGLRRVTRKRRKAATNRSLGSGTGGFVATRRRNGMKALTGALHWARSFIRYQES